MNWDSVSTIFTELASYINDANKRIYFWYLLGAVVLAIPVYLAANVQTKTGEKARIRKKSTKGFLAFLFNRKIWLAPSAKQDYVLFVLNKFIRGLLYAPAILLMVPVALWFSSVLESLFGAISFLTWSKPAIVATFTVALFIADDFTRFFLHFLLHKVPWLWQFHQVHHSATVLTPFTVYRSHPLESYLYACRMGLAQGLVVGAAYYVFGPQLSMFDIAGANVFVFAFNIMGSNLRHSHVWLSWGDKFENWLISPAQHQIHHSDNPKHFDTNLGSALAVWDRMFGTLIKASAVGRIRFGLGKGQNPHTSLWRIYLMPFVGVFKSLFRFIG